MRTLYILLIIMTSIILTVSCSSESTNTIKIVEGKAERNLPASNNFEPIDGIPKLDKKNLAKIIETDENLLIMNVWASWCGPCEAETPDFVRAANYYENESVKFIGLSVDKSEEAAVNFINHYKVGYDMYLIGVAEERFLRINGYPSTFFYLNGEQVDRVSGAIDYDTLLEYIDYHLNEMDKS